MTRFPKHPCFFRRGGACPLPRPEGAETFAPSGRGRGTSPSPTFLSENLTAGGGAFYDPAFRVMVILVLVIVLPALPLSLESGEGGGEDLDQVAGGQRDLPQPGRDEVPRQAVQIDAEPRRRRARRAPGPGSRRSGRSGRRRVPPVAMPGFPVGLTNTSAAGGDQRHGPLEDHYRSRLPGRPPDRRDPIGLRPRRSRCPAGAPARRGAG